MSSMNPFLKKRIFFFALTPFDVIVVVEQYLNDSWVWSKNENFYFILFILMNRDLNLMKILFICITIYPVL